MCDCLLCITCLDCQSWLCMSVGHPEVPCIVRLPALPVLHNCEAFWCDKCESLSECSPAWACESLVGCCCLSLALQQMSVHSCRGS